MTIEPDLRTLPASEASDRPGDSLSSESSDTPIDRRQFLAQSVFGMGAMLGASIARAAGKDAPVILLRSSWQTVNIGDIGHTPGVLHILEQQLPGASVILWPGNLGNGVDELLRRRFPKLRVVKDGQWKNPKPADNDPSLADALAEADFFLHGSGPSVVGLKQMATWKEKSTKPYGVLGTTIASVEEPARTILDGAAFVYTRETTSLDFIREKGIKCPEMGFVPDGTFAIDLRNDAAAEQLMAKHGLKPKEFVCFVPRLRWTPYWKVHPSKEWTPEKIATKDGENKATAEKDHEKLRSAIVQWVRETGLKAFICPEMEYAVEIINPLVFDPLPDDVKAKTARMDRYWLPDEAGSLYRQAFAVASIECHSPIIALAMGTPGMYIRQPTDTWKGQMYDDIGLGHWMFQIDQSSGYEIASRLLEIRNDPASATLRREKAMAFVASRFQHAAAQIQKAVG